jgi:hypothetical protein
MALVLACAFPNAGLTLFAYFPTYLVERKMAVGNALGIQSPLSFKGLDVLTRHLDHIATAMDKANLACSFIDDPTYMPTIVAHLVGWLGHVTMMGLYDLLHKVASPILWPVVNNALPDPTQKYRWMSRMESGTLEVAMTIILPDEGEGMDYHLDDYVNDDEDLNNTTEVTLTKR